MPFVSGTLQVEGELNIKDYDEEDEEEQGTAGAPQENNEQKKTRSVPVARGREASLRN